jgi:inner membrane protein
MDPLTHTLVGANLGSTRLGEKTRLAPAALVIGANLPDIDAILYFTGQSDFALEFRRGWTHGVLALFVLPFLQTALLMLYARMRRIDVSPRWLLILSAFAIVTHPTLDWLNNYGMRWLMPFRGTWFYGDSVFIMDPWLWLILGCGWLAQRRPTTPMIVAFVVVAALLAYVVGRRNPTYLAVVAVVAVIMLATLVWRAPRSFAAPALIVATLYIGARLTIHAVVAQRTRADLNAERLMVAPHPISPLRWDVVAQVGDEYRWGRWVNGRLTMANERIPLPKPSREWDLARAHPSVRGFVTWARFPWYEIDRAGGTTRVLLHDARYLVRSNRRGFGGAEVVLTP